jgi:hypothetical protein
VACHQGHQGDVAIAYRKEAPVDAENRASPERGNAASEHGRSMCRPGSARPHRADDCGPIVVIDRCAAARSYLVDCLEEATSGANIVAFASASQWLEVAQGYPRPKVVLIFNSGYRNPKERIESDRSLLANRVNGPVIAVPNVDVVACAHVGAPWSGLRSVARKQQRKEVNGSPNGRRPELTVR